MLYIANYILPTIKFYYILKICKTYLEANLAQLE